jgi:hypothetical protein
MNTFVSILLLTVLVGAVFSLASVAFFVDRLVVKPVKVDRQKTRRVNR